MNYHILSDSRRNSKYGFLSLILLVLVSFFVVDQIHDSFAQEDQTITLTTDKNYYLPGDIVQLSGVVPNQPGQLVALQIKDSTGNLILIRVVQADQDGNFALKFKIPSTASSGDFGITASARINGFVVTQVKEVSATVPEFGPTSSMVFVIAIVFMLAFFVMYGKFQRMTPKL